MAKKKKRGRMLPRVTGTYDKKARAIYVGIRDGRIVSSHPILSTVVADFDKKGKIVGLEILF